MIANFFYITCHKIFFFSIIFVCLFVSQKDEAEQKAKEEAEKREREKEERIKKEDEERLARKKVSLFMLIMAYIWAVLKTFHLFRKCLQGHCQICSQLDYIRFFKHFFMEPVFVDHLTRIHAPLCSPGAVGSLIISLHYTCCCAGEVNPFKPEFTIVIFIYYKPRIAVTILDS